MYKNIIAKTVIVVKITDKLSKIKKQRKTGSRVEKEDKKIIS